MTDHHCCCGCMHVKTAAVVVGAVTVLGGLICVFPALDGSSHKRGGSSTTSVSNGKPHSDVSDGARWGIGALFALWALAGLLVIVGRYTHKPLLFVLYLIMNGFVIAFWAGFVLLFFGTFFLGGLFFLPFFLIPFGIAIWFEWIVVMAYKWAKNGDIPTPVVVFPQHVVYHISHGDIPAMPPNNVVYHGGLGVYPAAPPKNDPYNGVNQGVYPAILPPSNPNYSVNQGGYPAMPLPSNPNNSVHQGSYSVPPLSGHELLIISGEKGFSYERILDHESCLKDAMMAVDEIEIVEPYLLEPHQMHNLTYFCQLLARRCDLLKSIRLKTLHETRQQMAAELGLLSRTLGVHLSTTYHQRHALHDRQVVFSGTGWTVRWDRGLDIYKDRSCNHSTEADFSRRACKEVRIHYLFDQRQ